MFNIGFGELVFILSVALLILGPRKLPELARGLGRFLREFRRQTEEVRSVVEREFYKMDQELEAPLPKLAPPEGTRSIPPLHEAHAIPAAARDGAEGDDAPAPDATTSDRAEPSGEQAPGSVTDAPVPGGPHAGDAPAAPAAILPAPHAAPAHAGLAGSNVSDPPSDAPARSGASGASVPAIQKAAES